MVSILFGYIGRAVTSRPWTVIVVAVLLAGLSAWVSAKWLESRTGQNELVGKDVEYNQRYLRFEEEFGDLEFLYVVVPVGDDPGRAIDAVDSVAGRLAELARGPDAVLSSVFHRIDPAALRFGFLHRSPDELRRLTSWLGESADRLRALASVDGLGSFFRFFAEALDTEALAREEAAGSEGFARWGFAVLDRTLDSALAVLRGDEPRGFERQLLDARSTPLRERGYLATENGRLLFIEIAPLKDGSSLQRIRAPLRAVREILADARAAFPDVEIGLTGRPVLQADEMETTESDVRLATILALVAVVVLFIIFFRELVRPFFAGLALAIAIVVTFGFVTITIGHITLLSIVFAAMLVGLGIDFGIHFVARYQDELARSGDPAVAVTAALEGTGVSIAVGALTTAAAFYTILFVDFEGLRELGFVAGSGVILCLVSMVTVLPASLLIRDRARLRRRPDHSPQPLAIPLIDRGVRHPVLVTTVATVATIACAATYRGLPYNPSIIDLQAEDLDSVRYEKRIIEESDFSTWYCAFVVDSVEAIERIDRRLSAYRDSGIVGETKSVLDYLPKDVAAKLDILRGAQGVVASIDPASPSDRVDPPAVAGALESLLERLEELDSAALRQGDRMAVEAIGSLAARTETLAESIAGASPAEIERLAAFQQGWFGEIRRLLLAVRGALAPEPFPADSLPASILRRVRSLDGSRYLVYAYPARDLWEEAPMEDFVGAMRDVDPNVTGTPVQVYESSRRMKDGFVQATIYSLITTLVLLLLDLRTLRESLLAVLPLAMGLIWLLGSIRWVGLEFNLANFFALPILIGCGIDGGVHLVHRFREYRSAMDVTRVTSSAVTLSFLTTAVGFGAMAFASHRGIRSLGQMMVVGLVALLLTTVVVLPAVLSLVERRRDRTGPAGRDPAEARDPGVPG